MDKKRKCIIKGKNKLKKIYIRKKRATFESLFHAPFIFPIPQFDEHIIARSKNK